MRLITNSNIADYVTGKQFRDNNNLNFIKFEDLDSDLKACGHNNSIATSCGGKSVLVNNLVADYFSELAYLDCAGE